MTLGDTGAHDPGLQRIILKLKMKEYCVRAKQ